MIRRAMVLAAGRGQRLAPLTDTCPKPLMRVGDAPLLEHILAFLRAGGIEDVVINLHHLGHMIAARIGDGRRFGLHVHYSPEDPVLDTGGGIKHAEHLLTGEPFVVANGDSLLELPLPEVLDFHQARGGIATMVLREPLDGDAFSRVDLDADQRVRCINARPANADVAGCRGLMFPGLHVLEPEIFRFMPGGGAFGIARETYPAVLAAGRPIYGFVTAARWLTIDTAPALAAADAAFRADPFAHRAAWDRLADD
jgi:NDP-sugar pyrophosphorylase family protein